MGSGEGMHFNRRMGTPVEHNRRCPAYSVGFQQRCIQKAFVGLLSIKFLTEFGGTPRGCL